MIFCIWGCGRKLKRLKSTFSNIDKHILYYFDANKNNVCGITVDDPVVLKTISSMKVVICTYFESIREEIKTYLMTEYALDERSIWSEEQMIAYFLKSYEDVKIIVNEVRLEASTVCQLDCMTCPMRIENYANLGKGYLTNENFKKFLIDNSSIKNIELSNYGEVFLNPELNKIIETAALFNVELTMNNGVNLNYMKDGIEESLVRNGVLKSITISIDGVSQDNYKKYRRNGDINKVFNNIKRINDAKKKYKTELPVIIWQFILFEHNEDDIEAAVNLANQLDMRLVFKLDWDGEYIPKDKEKVSKLTGLRYFNRKEYMIAENKDYCDVCNQLLYSPQINYDGRLLGCCSTRNTDWGVNVFEKGLQEAVNSEKYKSVVANLLKGEKFELDSPCSQCERIKSKLLLKPMIKIM